MGSSASHVACAIRIAKAKSNRALATRNARRCTDCASSAWSRRKPIWIAGRRTGPTRASTAPRSGKWLRCLPRNGRCSGPCPSSRFGTTASGGAPSISTAAWKSRPRTTPRRPAGSASASRCNGRTCTSVCWRRRRVSSCASMSGPRADTAADARAARARPARRRASPHRLRPHPRSRRRGRCTPHPRCAGLGQEVRRRGGR